MVSLRVNDQFFLGGIKLDANVAGNCLKDFPCYSTLFGLVYYNDPCHLGPGQRGVVSTFFCF